MSFPLDEEAAKRRDVWLAKFLYDAQAVPDSEGQHPADRLLEPILNHPGGYWNERIAPFFAELYAVTGLEAKTVELIATALLALRGWETGVRAHARLALDSGASPEEIRGAILITLGIGGITAAANGLGWVEPILAAHKQGDAE
jgi:AhpD family alkylhydroperoxidase